jgi:competence protein ComEA
MDPNPMPWRAIDSASPPTQAAEAEKDAQLALGPLAIVGAAGLILIAAFVLAFGSGSAGGIEVGGATALGSPDTSAAGAAPSAGLSDAGRELVVEIVGAVVRPGVYHLPPGARVGDLVVAAGGYGQRVDADAASRSLNLAARLADGDQVRVPSRDDAPLPPPGTAGGGTAGGPGAPVDLNTATSAELEALPGIGPATAAKIVAAREEARFAVVEDLRTRKLVGQKTFDGLKDLVTVR